MKEDTSYYVYLFFWKLVSILPEKTAYRFFDWLAARMLAKNSRHVQRLRINYSIVRPELSHEELEELVLKGLRSYARYWCDTFRIHKWNEDRVFSTVTTTNDHLLRDPMAEGRGVIIALPHSGNWDHAGAYFCHQGIPLVTVAEVLSDPRLFKRFLDHRTRMGFEIFALDSRAFVMCLKRAHEKKLIALVADRDLSDSGIPVEFFGKKTKMPAGPALLAIRSGNPLVVAHVSQNERGIHINFTPVEVPTSGTEEERVIAIVKNIAAEFQKGIHEHPQDWHMMQKFWIEEGLYS